MVNDEPPKRRLISVEPTAATTPGELLDEIVTKIRASAHDHDRLLDIGVGELESMFHQSYTDDVWPEIVRLAETEPAFLWALGKVWADHPPLDALLWRLGHWRRFTLTAVLSDSPGEADGLSIRAPAIEGFDPAQVPGLLRRIAAAIEENPGWARRGIHPEDGETVSEAEA